MTDSTTRGQSHSDPDEVEETLSRIAACEPRIHAFVDHRPEQVRMEVSEVATAGSLAGACIAIKEVFDVAGYRCSWGTPIHANRMPSEDAEVVRRIKAAGGIVAGTTVSTEYALARPGPTVNPYDPDRTPGASSSGSAAAVGAGMVKMALGSQTIGSIIRPAAYCGVVGVKPTWGSIDPRGAMPLSLPIDHIGVLADCVASARRLLGAILDSGDVSPFDTAGVKVLRLSPWFDEQMSPPMGGALAATATRFARAGFDVKDSYLPADIRLAEEQALMTILCHDLVQHHGGDFNRAGDRMSTKLRELMKRGQRVTSEEYKKALCWKDEIAKRLDDMLGTDAVFLAPATLGVAPLRIEGTGSRAPQRLWTLGGLTTVTVPVALDEGLPLGIQIVAARGCDRLALSVAEAIETPARNGTIN